MGNMIQVRLHHKVIAWLLTLCLTITLIPDIGYAVESNSTGNKEVKEPVDRVTEEDVIERSESVTTYDMGNGEKMSVFHGGDVRFKNGSGEWEDYDPSLVRIKAGERTGNNQTLEGYKYRNKTGDKKHYFPESLSESTPVIMENGEYRIEITPTDETVETASLTDTQAYVQKETVPSVYEGEEQLPVNAVYENKSGRLGIRYTSGEHGIKETILLNRKPDSGIFEYTINVGKLDIKKNVTDEGLTIYDKKTDEIVACIDAPWMNDADGDSYSQDISYDLEKDKHTEGQYKLTMNVDEGYLFDSDRKYPVTIDPTTTWKGDDELRDVYVISGSYAGTNFYESGTKVMPSGRNNTGTHRTYIKPLNLKSKISGKSVSSAKLTVYETGNGVSKQKIKAYRVLENWSSTSLTWNNKPKNASDPTAKITTTKTAKSAKTFDMTGFARKIAGGTSNYGVVLKNMTSNSSYAEFHGSRATLTSCRPKLSVTYHDVPTTPESFSLSRKSGESYTSSSYHKKGRTIYASWTGISSYSLAQVQYKIIAGDNNTAEPSSVGTNNVDLTKYRSIGLASDSAVNKGVSYTSSLPAGVYKIYLRGKDDAGNYGTAKSKTFYIDGTAPVLTDVKTVPQTSASSYTKNLMPTVSWNTEDTFFSKVTVSIDGDEEVSATTTSGTGSYAVPSGKITSSGKHTIKVTAYDKSGNTKSSTLDYYVDKDEPEGSISLSSPGYDAENSDLSGTVNVAVTMQGTGSPLKTVTLKLYKITDTGTESTLSANLITDYLNDENKENDSSNTDLDTTKLDNGRYRFKLHMEDKAGNTRTLTKDVTVLNRLAAPGISVSDTTNGTVSVHWSLDDEVRLESIQYRIGNDGTWQNGQIVSNGSSEGEFDITLPSENKYRIYFRGKAKDGTVGESTSRNVVYDKTAPHIRIVDFVQGYIKGTISDTSRLTWRMYIKEKTQADSAYVEICSGTENIENGNIGFVNLGAEIYASGREYVIKVTAVDALGNQSSETYEVYKTSDGKSAELIDAGFRVKRPAYQGYDSGKIVFPSDMTKMSLKKANEQSWPQGLTRWYVDNQLVSSNEIYEDDFSTTGRGNESAGYDENVEYDIFVIHKQDSGEIWYSNDVIKNGDVQELELSEDTISNGNINKTISVSGKKVVSFRITESQQVPQKEGVTYQIKIDESEYIDVEPNENFIIADKIQDKAYAESITLRVRAGSNTSVNDISVSMDIIPPESSEVFTLSEAENYRPHNLSVADKINYKTYIMWENEITADTPENIYYEVYRGTEPDFVPGPDNLAATNIRAGYYSEINVNYRGNFYYRIRAVKENDGIKSGSGYSEQVYSRVVDGNEYIKRMGVKDYWEFAEIETPLGDLNIEKSMGNMVYSQKDADIPNEQLEVALNRTYNSQATSKSAFGVGWSHDFDIELLKICRDDEINDDNIIMKDGSGTIFHFIKNNGEYSSSLGKYINLEVKEETKEVKLPLGKAGVAGTGEKKSIMVTSSYRLTTKDGLEYRFNSGGQLVFMSEPNGNFLIFEHDPVKGLLKNVITSKNLVMSFTYNTGDDSGLFRTATDPLTVKTVTLPDGSTLDYDYEGDPATENVRLVRVKANNSGNDSHIEYLYEYDSSEVPNISKIYDAEGNTYDIEYNSKDQVSRVIYPDGEAIELTYSSGAAVSMEKTIDDVESAEYLARDTQTITRKIVDGDIVSSEKDIFNGYGNCISSTDAEGYVTNRVYSNKMLHRTESFVQSHYIDSDGYVVSEPDNVKTEISNYDAESQNLIDETEEDGSFTTYEYNDNASGINKELPVSEAETDGDGKAVFDIEHSYDSYGNETSEYDAVSDTTTVTEYYYEDSAKTLKGEVKKETEYLGTPQNGKLQSVTTYEYLYNSDGGKTEKTTQVCGGESITTTVRYDSMGREIENTDSRGRRSVNSYDGYGRLIKTVNTDGDIVTETSKEYNNNGSVTIETAEDGTVTGYTYDDMDRVVTRTVQKGNFSKTWNTSYSYEDVTIFTGKGTQTKTVENAFKTTETTPDGISEVTWQDHLGRVIREFKNGAYIDMTYDSQDNVITQYEFAAGQQDGKGLLTMHLYDSAGNKTHTILNPVYEQGRGFYTGNDAIVNEWEYDSSGNEIKRTDGEGNSTNLEYDEEGNVTSVTLPDGATSIYTYDQVNTDGTTSDYMIDPKGNISEVKKDQSDLEVMVADLGNRDGTPIRTEYEYDSRENIIKEIDSEGNYRTYVYDGRDRKIKADHYDKNGNVKLRTIYEYDISDNLTLMKDYRMDSGEPVLLRYTSYFYDELKRLSGIAELDGPAVPAEAQIESAKISFEYDFDDKLRSVTYPEDGSHIKKLLYEYNSYGWIAKIKADTSGLFNKTVREYIYAADGKLQRTKDYKNVLSGGSGYIQCDYTYDDFQRVTGITYSDVGDTDAVKESYEYTYDRNSNILTETIINDWPQSEDEKIHEIRTHAYDEVGRLIETSITDLVSGEVSSEISYTYDSSGNRITENVDGVVTTYGYNSFNQMTNAVKVENDDVVSDKVYQYDKNGNQISETDSVTKSSHTMTYDAAGNMSRFVGKNDGSIEFTQENLYNGNGQRIRKTEADDTVVYYYQGSSVIRTADATGTLTGRNIVGASDDIISTTRGTDDEKLYVYTKDIRESTGNMVDQDGSSEVSYAYDDFGETEIRGNHNLYNQVCYTGGIYDDTTGLYYLNARYYDPEDASFLSQDTYRGESDDPQSLNLYAYCNNNPIIYTDPTGHFPWIAAAIWGYRAYKAYKTYKKIKKVYKVVKTVRKVRKAYKATKKVKRYYSKPKTVKKWRKYTRKSNKKSRISRHSYKKKKVSRPKHKTSKKTSSRGNIGCFTAGTKISTDKGFKAIEKIKPGDRVWSEDTRTGEKALKKVKKIFVREKDSIIRLSINGEVIETTEEHPFWVKDTGWVPAGSLEESDNVKLLTGIYAPVEKYEIELLREPVTVYNFHVEDYECYYVSEQQVLVHNNNKCGVQSYPQYNNKQITELAKEHGYKKTGQRIKGQPVFKKGNKYIVQDIDSHNGGVWKMAKSIDKLKSRKSRLGTYDKNLKRIGD